MAEAAADGHSLGLRHVGEEADGAKDVPGARKARDEGVLALQHLAGLVGEALLCHMCLVGGCRGEDEVSPQGTSRVAILSIPSPHPSSTTPSSIFLLVLSLSFWYGHRRTHTPHLLLIMVAIIAGMIIKDLLLLSSSSSPVSSESPSFSSRLLLLYLKCIHNLTILACRQRLPPLAIIPTQTPSRPPTGHQQLPEPRVRCFTPHHQTRRKVGPIGAGETRGGSQQHSSRPSPHPTTPSLSR